MIIVQFHTTGFFENSVSLQPVVLILVLAFDRFPFLHLRDNRCTLTLNSFQPVEVCVPYHRTKRREVVVQRCDGQSCSTLPTVLRRGSETHSSHPGGRPARVK